MSQVNSDPGTVLKAKRFGLPSFPDVMVGPFGHLADERTRLAGLSWNHFDARPVDATIGAELSGIDLTAGVSDAALAELRDALHAYKVIFFRDQPLTAEQHVALASRFGELEVHPFFPSNTREPALVRFEKGADTGGYENGWHHDVTWREMPSAAAMLHALQVPATGGDTLFCDMAAAYEGLPGSVKTRIDNLDAVHDYVASFGQTVPANKQQEMRELYPEATHPVVVRHEATGAKLLYVNRFFTSHIVGISDSESRDLIDLLARQSDTLEYQCRFRWENDSVAFWDNRAVQHYAASDYWPSIRIMERASIVGERPTC